jgi:hypothetical protein
MKQRRIIYNNDGGDLFLPGADTPDRFLSKRLTGILGTQVDSVFYCTGATTIFTHLTKVGETYGEFIDQTCDQEWALGWLNLKNNIQALRQNGQDVLNIVVEWCKKNSLEIFWTHRINDIHDSMRTCDPELSRWKREHPEYCMGPAGDALKGNLNSPKAWWSSLDFERPEVLDYLYRITEDVCRRYDIDGIEIDYFRSPMFFRPNLEFQPATAAQVDILTNFQRRIREMARREGQRRGREILLAGRVPMTEPTCRHVGIDIVGWLKENLLDVLTTGGGYIPYTMPTHEMVNLGHHYGKPVYPTISDSGLRNRYQSPLAWNGAAANVLAAGADGLCTFNLWANRQECPKVSLMDIAGHAGSLQTLAKCDKVFAIDNHPCLEGDLVQAIEQFQILPAFLESWGKPWSETLIIADDIPAARKNGSLKEVKMLLQFENLLPEDLLEVQLNRRTITPTSEKTEDGWLTFNPDPALYRPGKNEVYLRMVLRPMDVKQPVVLKALEVHVKYS